MSNEYGSDVSEGQGDGELDVSSGKHRQQKPTSIHHNLMPLTHHIKPFCISWGKKLHCVRFNVCMAGIEETNKHTYLENNNNSSSSTKPIRPESTYKNI